MIAWAHLSDSTELPLRSPGLNPDLLRSIPYVAAMADPQSELRGVTRRAAMATADGLNFYAVDSGAVLIDMAGREVLRWTVPGTNVFHATLLPNGDVIAIGAARTGFGMRAQPWRIVRVDVHSRVLWVGPREQWHHDLSVAPDGRIVALFQTSERRKEIGTAMPLISDYLGVLSPRGELLQRISLLDALRDSPYAFLMPSLAGETFQCEFANSDRCGLDVLHANHVEVFDGSVNGSPLYARGNFLVSLRAINTILILDGVTHKVMWAWGPGNLTQQHDPTLLANGNILMFDNGLSRSEAVELDPRTNRVVWRYAAQGFFSATQGSVQRLPNGNTLITESEKGRVFELTPEGTIVWEFRNPLIDDHSKRTLIWRMVRFRLADLPFLAPS